MFKECEPSEHKALREEGLTHCPRCEAKLDTVVPYSKFKEYQRSKKYGSFKKRTNELKAKGYPDDFTFGVDEH
ncbi:MAG: hypothetical protein ACFFCW_38480 [Candidatus Hodarchaeota archaeon]